MPARRASLFQQVITLSAARPLFFAFGHITLSGTGDVLSWHDSNDDAHVYTQSDTAKQCDPPAGHADYANALCLTFTGVEWYQSNRAAAAWNFGHTGDSGVFGVGTATNLASNRRLLGTRTSVANRGFSLQWTTAGDINFAILGAATTQFSTTQAAPLNTPVQFSMNYLEGGNLGPGEYAVKVTGSAEGGGISVAAPDAGDATESARLGGRGTTPDLLFVGRLVGLVHTPALTAPNRAIVRQYFQQLTTVAA